MEKIDEFREKMKNLIKECPCASIGGFVETEVHGTKVKYFWEIKRVST